MKVPIIDAEHPIVTAQDGLRSQQVPTCNDVTSGPNLTPFPVERDIGMTASQNDKSCILGILRNKKHNKFFQAIWTQQKRGCGDA